MGLTTGEFPPVDPATFLETPYLDRIKILSRFWAENGFGAAKVAPLTYVTKLLVLSALGGVMLATFTSGINPFSDGDWWKTPIVWQKLVIWTMLLETIGIAGSWGPLAGHFKPMTGGILYWARPKTIRVPPWPAQVPLTGGDERTVGDVAVYLGLVTFMVLGVVLPGSGDSAVGAHLRGDAGSGLVSGGILYPLIALLVVMGLRDKVVFIAARSEQYLPALVFFAAYPILDMIIAAKILIVSVWVGAGVSKFGKHFSFVIPPMMSNTPWISSKAFRRSHYRSFPEDLLPSKVGSGLAHIGGTFVECVTPFVLLFSHSRPLTVAAVLLMVVFHLVITSTFPLAVPLEWNVLFMYLAVFLFLGYPAQDGFGLSSMNAGLAVLTIAAVVFFPVLGNLRPDLVSFLPSMRQYAGNWATAMWAFAPGAEQKLNQHVVKSAPMTVDQLTAVYGAEAAEVVLHQLLGWRAMHSQGRALNSIMMRQLGEDIDTYTLREAEFSCNALIAFNFGDGHLHDEKMIASLQKRCRFAAGEFVIVWIESQAIHRDRQDYMVIDAALGVVEKGSFAVADATSQQPWLPNGPIPVQVDWRLDGYERVRHGGLGAVDTLVVDGPHVEASPFEDTLLADGPDVPSPLVRTRLTT